MRRTLGSCALVFCWMLFPLTPADGLRESIGKIQAKALLSHVEYLSSDECGGRDTPSPGLEKAGNYIAEQFRAAGLEPGGDNGSYFRNWDWEITETSSAAKLQFESKESNKSFAVEKDFLVIEGSPEKELSGEPVFLGYGIESSHYRYNDFLKGNPNGKIVLAFSHEPCEKEKGQAFDGLEATQFSSFYEKAKLVAKYGGLALLIITDPKNHTSTEPIEYHRKRARNGVDKVTANPEIPIFSISLSTAEEILGKKLLPIQESIDRSLISFSIPCPGKKLTLKSAFDKKVQRIKNIVAFRKGSDPNLSKEVVVFGAHYDHVGTDDRGVVWHGADDNASGSSSLIEVGKAFAATPTPRTVLFIAFSGEEVGLLGSEGFMRNPTFPATDMIAMLNADQVGRGKKDIIWAIGTQGCPGMLPPLKKAEQDRSINVTIETKRGQEFFHRSDQANFFKAGVPVLFFVGDNPEHQDYHRSTDTADRIDAKKLESCARVIFFVMFQLATDKNRPERPKG